MSSFKVWDCVTINAELFSKNNYDLEIGSRLWHKRGNIYRYLGENGNIPNSVGLENISGYEIPMNINKYWLKYFRHATKREIIIKKLTS